MTSAFPSASLRLQLTEDLNQRFSIVHEDFVLCDGAPLYGHVESFNGKLKDELLNGEIFYTLKEAQTLIERWRIHFNTKRPHSSLGYKPPAPEAYEPTKRLTISMAGLT